MHITHNMHLQRPNAQIAAGYPRALVVGPQAPLAFCILFSPVFVACFMFGCVVRHGLIWEFTF